MKLYVTLGAGLAASALLLLGTGSAQAQVPATAKCSAAKVKCVNTKATALLGCHNKAESKGEAVDPECITKAEQKFNLPAKGCIQKAESKPPCKTNGDAASLETTVDDFVNDVVVALDPGYPTPVENKCSAGKKKCVANKVKALLTCSNKNITKPDALKLAECLAKAKAKFDGGDDPSKGCFAKLEAKPPCLTTGDSGALETAADVFSAGITLTILNPTTLDFATGPPQGICGSMRDGNNTILNTCGPQNNQPCSLGCGSLNLGGGLGAVPPGPIPDGSVSRFTLACSAGLCNLGATTAVPPVNTAGPDCSNTGCNFGTPLPIPNPSIPTISTCVLNTWSAPASGTVNLITGAANTSVPLSSDIYLTGNVTQPCPRCSATGSPSSPGTGTCDRGPRLGMPCTTTSSTGVTRDCPTGGTDATHPCTPGGGACLDGFHVGAISVNLTPLTTSVATATNATGAFCTGQHPGCFGEAGCRTIIENGVPPVSVSVGIPTPATLASVFCILATGNGLVDATADLPGPGGIALPGTFTAN